MDNSKKANVKSVLEFVEDHPGSKAKEIAQELGTEKKEVNRILYNNLKDECYKDKQYRWYLNEVKKEPKQHQEVMHDSPSKNTTKDKVRRLFQYLEEALRFDKKEEWDLMDYSEGEYRWWFGELFDNEHVFVRGFDDEDGDDNDYVDEDGVHIWLETQKQSLPEKPEVPTVLRGWLKGVRDINQTPERVKEKRQIVKLEDNQELYKKVMSFKEDADEEDGRIEIPKDLADWIFYNGEDSLEVNYEKVIKHKFNSSDERVEQFNEYSYLWEEWQEEVVPIAEANKFYDQLFALRQKLKNDGDNYVLFLGHTILTWKKGGKSVRMPIFKTELELNFYPEEKRITLSPNASRDLQLDIDKLLDLAPGQNEDLLKFSNKFVEGAFNPWNYTSMKEEGKYLTGLLSADSGFSFNEAFTGKPSISKEPDYHNAPVVFLKESGGRLWVQYARKARESVEKMEADDLSPFVRRLVGGREGVVGIDEGDDVTDEAVVDIPDGELYFPLPYNKEQKEIAHQLDASDGVVVEGPPGTGKSHTIANIIARNLAKGNKVLVTAQKSKPLEVIRGQLPEALQSLIVPQLKRSAKQDEVLQKSINDILRNFGRAETAFKQAEIDNLHQQLDKLRKQRAQINGQILEWVELDSKHEVSLEGKKYQPIQVAKRLNKQNEHNWIPDSISIDEKKRFSESDIVDLVEGLSRLEKDEVGLHEMALPDSEKLFSNSEFENLVGKLQEINRAQDGWDDVFENTRDKRVVEKYLDTQTLDELLTDIDNAIDFISELSGWSKALFRHLQDDLENEDFWRGLEEELNKLHDVIDECESCLIGENVDVGINLRANDVDLVKELSDNFDENESVGFLKKAFLFGRKKELVRSVSINEQPISSGRDIELLTYKVRMEVSWMRINTIWRQVFEKVSRTFPEEGFGRSEYKEMYQKLVGLLEYTDNFSNIKNFFDLSDAFAEKSITSSSDLKQIRTVLSLYQSVLNGELFNDEKDKVLNYLTELSNPHQVVGKFETAITELNVSQYSEALDILTLKEKKIDLAQQVSVKAEKIKDQVPQLYNDVFDSVFNEGGYKLPGSLTEAWKHAQLRTWLNNLHDKERPESLRVRLAEINKKIEQKNAEFIAKKSWRKLIEQVRDEEKAGLKAWKQAMEEYGKGTGKYASKHLNDARKALKKAQKAVPVWVMSLGRVVKMFEDPVEKRFDLVIFDEASQCDLRALLVAQMAKKVLVVGDPEQISPSGRFKNKEEDIKLVNKYLYDLEYEEGFSVYRSLYNIANMRFDNLISLIEHFRCVPEIIDFSNSLSYQNRIQPLRQPLPDERLLPVKKAFYVEDGYVQKNAKINKPEADSIIKKIEEIIEDPQYDNSPTGERVCTIGVITLWGPDQQKYINRQIQKHFSGKVIDDRGLMCGDSYAFQGDERDVILLSMVKGLDQDDPTKTIRALTTKDAKRRFNVAVSRASDQIFLFHSIPRGKQKNPQDLRGRLINWFYSPYKEDFEKGVEVLKEKADSDFEIDVGKKILGRGYDVVPQFEVIGYKIDLVVQNGDARLAVECDGDQYHSSPEQVEYDIKRQQQLERAGWEFWRVSGSQYYRHQEEALESLWERLDELGIEPANNTIQDGEG
jgi:superfamily I DNA and/or RNA helicase